ncbi:MAG: hypothetical protein QXG00_04215 [Candidatus Woesearchaeota archaeon]
MNYYIEIEKAQVNNDDSEKYVKIPIQEFIDEHKRLIKRLKKKNKNQLDKERIEQQNELKNFLKKIRKIK